MESPDYSPPHVDASRPSLGFPLGTALLLIIIFSLSGIFSCCYHWDKLRSLRRSYTPGIDDADDIEHGLYNNKPPNKDLKENQRQSLPVLMPGDKIPKFIAFPCPCEPPRDDKVVVDVPKPPIKPARLPVVAVPLY
ncbi:hypothetical protein TIFTF001_004514 [Ficus carica]|uniref:Hydroxyproline-rich glycoprotein family protein n=1 Tax=Ficus carica TaxID=3494 RepID=A0AA87ZI04_FICCA|nr:hypothetical protein TIFTF001_004514 [Ficus carica]